MKKISRIIMLGSACVFVSSCQKYLNINHNPNQAVASTPDVVLPQAITYTAENVSGFNDYGSQLVGFAANAGGYGGFGSNWTYDFGPNDYSNLWATTYDALEDLQYVINSTATDTNYEYFNAAARILKVYNFEMMVDTYNNVPYFGALQGTSASLTPKYDDAKLIYQDLALQLDTAISLIENVTDPTETALTVGSDPLFQGNMMSWIQFANTLKLRLFIRAAATITFTDPTFDANGFLSTDAIVNPGFQKATGQQNPSWNTWVQSYTGTNGNRAWMACTFAFGYYDGTKLQDSSRGKAIYFQYPATPNNQLGDGLTGVPFAPATTNAWYSTVLDPNLSILPNVGVEKGPGMGEPLMLAAESYFLQSEGDLRGIITAGTASANFYSGILASFNYLYSLPGNNNLPLGAYGTGFSPTVGDSTYLADNATSYLVNFSLATTPAQETEAIITQKYIALNFISGAEAWNEYRRTLYPTIVDGSQDAYATFASTLSQSTRPDKLPTRILYPANEYDYNAANVPSGISPYTSLIFWAHP